MRPRITAIIQLSKSRIRCQGVKKLAYIHSRIVVHSYGALEKNRAYVKKISRKSTGAEEQVVNGNGNVD